MRREGSEPPARGSEGTSCLDGLEGVSFCLVDSPPFSMLLASAREEGMVTGWQLWIVVDAC